MWVGGWKQFESLNKTVQSLKLDSLVQSGWFDYIFFFNKNSVAVFKRNRKIFDEFDKGTWHGLIF